jgi:hypothetical protein
MQHRALLQVNKERLRTIDRLEQQEVGNLGHPTAPWLRQTCRQRLAALVQQAAQLAHVAVEDRVALRVQHRRHVVGVEHDLVVGLALDDACHADRCKTVAGIAL